MKKCPQCGAMMEKDVNFCTSCGYDLRNVDVQKEKTVSAADLVQNTAKTGPQQTEPEVQNVNTPNKTEGQFQNYWQWCVDSWRNPGTSNPNVASWYGWLTILIKDALVVLGLYFCANTIINTLIDWANHRGSNISGWENFHVPFNIMLEIFVIVVIFEAVVIGGFYAGYRYIYDRKLSFLEFVNRSAHACNLNLILAAAFFLLMILGLNSIKFVVVIFLVMLGLFIASQHVILFGDDGAVRDKIYGFLIAFAIIFLCLMILDSIIYSSMIHSIINQIMATQNGSM